MDPHPLPSPASCLITGGAGFLGLNLARFLLQRGHAVRSLDIAEFSDPDVRNQVDAVRGDERDRAGFGKKIIPIPAGPAVLALRLPEALHLFEITSGVTHRVPWKQGLLGLAKLFF